MLALAAVLLLLIAAQTAREMANTEPGEGVIFDLVYAFSEAYIVAAGALVVGAMVYQVAYLRGVRITFAEAIFNWAVVLGAAVAALLVYLQ